VTRTILIMAGGTGGHVFPALAVAGELVTRGWRVAWLGTRAGMEATLVAQRGYPIEWVSMAGVRGKRLLNLLLLPYALLVAFAQAIGALLRQRPDVVLGMGGYAAFPGGMMAALLFRPLVIHEQNSIAGLTNRVLAGVADRVLLGFPKAFDRPIGQRAASLLPRPRRTEWVGNPVRQEIASLVHPARRYMERSGALRLLVIGGSQGARALNEAVPEALSRLDGSTRPLVVHQAGAAQFDALVAGYAAAQVQGELVPFIDDMAARYAWCDLLICRAGALTCAEIAAVGVASILVPFPSAVDDHQTHNAHFLVDAGAALLLPQSELTPERLAEKLRELTRPVLQAMAEKARALAKPDATVRVADVCEEIAA